MGGSAGKADIIAVTIPSNKTVLNDVKGQVWVTRDRWWGGVGGVGLQAELTCGWTDFSAKQTYWPNGLFHQTGFLAKEAFWLTGFKASFNRHPSRKIVYSPFFVPIAFNLVFTENRRIDSSVVQHFRKRLLQNLQNEPPCELLDNLTRMTLKMLVTNSW